MRKSPGARDHGKPDTWGQRLARKKRLEAFQKNKTSLTPIQLGVREDISTLITSSSDNNYYLIYNNCSQYKGKDEKETIRNLLQLEYFAPLTNNLNQYDSTRLLNHLGDILVKLYRKGRNFEKGSTLMLIESGVREIIGISGRTFYNQYIKGKKNPN